MWSGIEETINDLEIFDPEFVNIPKLAIKIAEHLEKEGEDASDWDTGLTLFELAFNKSFKERDMLRHLLPENDYEPIGKELRFSYEVAVEIAEEQKEEQEQRKKGALKELRRVPELPEKQFPGGSEYLREKNKYKVKKTCDDLADNLASLTSLDELKEIASDLDLAYPVSINKRDLCKMLVDYYDRTVLKD